MCIYAKILRVLSFCNLAICISINALGYINQKLISDGTVANSISLIFLPVALHISLILIVVFSIKAGSETIEKALRFNIKIILCYIAAVLNYAYCTFFITNSSKNASLSEDRLMPLLAIAILLNISIAIVTTGYLRLLKTQGGGSLDS